MSERNERAKLSKLSRIELVELIYDIRKDNVALEKRCKALEDKIEELQAREKSEAEGNIVDEHLGVIDERLDGLEDLVRDVRRYLKGRRSFPNSAENDERGLA